jgi:hypothetical protein
MSGGAITLAACLAAGAGAGDAAPARLPPRVSQIVLHVLGHPSYSSPERRFIFYPPPDTQALWKRRFGAHWIVWTDGSIWPRHVTGPQPASWMPDPARPVDAALRRRLAAEAAPVYAHVHRLNRGSVGIEVAHSGRGQDPFPQRQVDSVAFLVRTLLEMSEGRLGPAAVVGHKDLDRRPAYVRTRCQRPGCPVFVDPSGQPYRRRVDPPEALFQSLARAGLSVPRGSEGDADLARAEALLPAGRAAGVGW